MFGHHHFSRGGNCFGPGAERKREFFKSQMAGGGFRRPKFNVPVNVADKENAFEVHVYATGFLKENIKITVEKDILHISGTREVNEKDLPQFSQQEFPVKSFERVLGLNGQIDIEAITAVQEDGILKITLPRNAESRQPSKEIKVD